MLVISDELRLFKAQLSSHPEVSVKQRGPCLIIHALRYPCYGDAGVYRLQWIRNNLHRWDCQDLRITSSEPYELTICTKPSKMFSDKGEFP